MPRRQDEVIDFFVILLARWVIGPAVVSQTIAKYFSTITRFDAAGDDRLGQTRDLRSLRNDEGKMQRYRVEERLLGVPSGDGRMDVRVRE